MIDGGALRLYRLGHPEVRLDRANPQAVVPAGVWQAAEPDTEAVLVAYSYADDVKRPLDHDERAFWQARLVG